MVHVDGDLWEIPQREGQWEDILTHFNRSRPSALVSMANDRHTHAFLRAAMDFTREVVDTPLTSEDADRRPPTLSYLSVRKVVERAKKIEPGATVGKYRNRWLTQEDFYADFVAYALRGRHWSLHLAKSDGVEDLLLNSDDIARAVHEIALQDLLAVVHYPEYRFQLLAAASANADATARNSLVAMYKTLVEAWGSLYGKAFEHFGVSLRPGLTMDMFNIALQAAAEGIALRIVSGVTDEPLLDKDARTSLLGTTVIALFVAFVDAGDGLTLEEAFNISVARSHARQEGTGAQA